MPRPPTPPTASAGSTNSATETAPGIGARAAALYALGQVLDRRAPLEDALARAPGFTRLAARDRAFARLLAATALRRAGEIDAVLHRCLDRPLAPGAATARRILDLACVQLLYLDTPAHAAVATAVALADRARASRYKGLVNAVARRVAREGRGIVAALDSARVNTPDWLWRSWCAAYGEETARRIAAAHLGEPPLDLTPRRDDDGAALARELGCARLATGTVRLGGAGAVEALPGYGDGRWWVQDAAAALPARLFGHVSGHAILDIGAAPGGKTLQLAAAGARVTALDIAAARLRRLRENLDRTGLDAELVTGDGRSFDPPIAFDGVLLDAPCSATGTLRRHPDIARTKSRDDIARLIAVQDALLANAARLTRKGGMLIYAVCSLEPEEGEQRIERFLQDHPRFRAIPIAAREIGGLAEAITKEGFLRTLPCHLAEAGGMDGFFAARLQRVGEAAT